MPFSHTQRLFGNTSAGCLQQKETPAMSRPIVLLIEQDASLQLLYSEVVRSAGYTVIEITHDDDIVATAIRCRPAVALISGGQRGLFRAGWVAAEELKHVFPALPLVMIATNSAAVREVGQTQRGQAFVAALQKPFQLDELLTLLARYAPHSNVTMDSRPEFTP